MPVKITVNGEVVTAYLDGEIDHHTASVMRNEIDSTIERNMPSMLVLDFRDVTFMDSSGIGLIMGRYARMQRIGGGLILRNPSERVERICRLAGLERIVTIEKGGEENEG